MPFTPFHFGTGLAIKAVLPRHFSFTVFAFTNIAIDIEPLYLILNGRWPLHGFFHTYVGATLIALVSIFIGRFICSWVLQAWNGYLKSIHINILHYDPQLAYRPVIMGAFIGAYSHIFLDSIMHSDIRPFFPFTNANPLLSVLSLYELHLICFFAGVLGFIVLLVSAIIKRN